MSSSDAPSETIRKIKVIKYDPNWPKLFKKEAEQIKQALGSNCIEVHYIGSTSIPGLSAKPIIDILPVVQKFKRSIKQPKLWRL